MSDDVMAAVIAVLVVGGLWAIICVMAYLDELFTGSAGMRCSNCNRLSWMGEQYTVIPDWRASAKTAPWPMACSRKCEEALKVTE